ncbi:MAG: glycosyltransferase family 2 protein [Bacteroidia bacterium]|nr:glycosyltransferase family 2 protein [Bacteroidia bacterium]
MKLLSIIIVNYNVQYYLEQVLHSVKKACSNFPKDSVEIWVVDNASKDGSVEMLQKKFSDIHLIVNSQNVGFSKANNQAIAQAQGKYVLLLNPDTILQEDTLEKCIAFMESHPEAGALGVKMIDGKGKFLPESKRGLPTPQVSMYKMLGFHNFFPKSAKFNRYYLGHLPNDQNHEVEVLSGAFMFIRKAVLDKIGYLDENFFMYGEDIDLSYRITLAGYKNYYLSETQILHYKGESTKKSSVNYVVVFYDAMLIFAKKHFDNQYSKLFRTFIKTAVYGRAFLALLRRFWDKFGLAIIDLLVMLLVVLLVKDYWERNHRWIEKRYPITFYTVALPAYLLIWSSSLWLSGCYQKKYKISTLIKAILTGTVFIAALTFFFKQYAFSRMIILMSTLGVISAITLLRYLSAWIKYKSFKILENAPIHIGVVASDAHYELVRAKFSHYTQNAIWIGNILPSGQDKFIALQNWVEIYQVDELIFYAADMSYEDILNYMQQLSKNRIKFHIVPPQSDYLIGSNSVFTDKDPFHSKIDFALEHVQNKVFKRGIELLMVIFILLFSPVFWLIQKQKKHFFRNIWDVLIGKKHLVGYSSHDNLKLPKLKPSLLSTVDKLSEAVRKSIHSEQKFRLDYRYALHYTVSQDIEIVLKNLHRLG